MKFPFAAAAMAAGLALAAPVRADGPDYGGALTYAKSIVAGTLTEKSRCLFEAASPASAKAVSFNAGALGIVPAAIAKQTVSFECLKGSRCVASAGGGDAASVSFAVHGDALGAAEAIGRVIELCSRPGGH